MNDIYIYIITIKMKIYILRITDKSSINAHELYTSPTIKISAGG